MKVAYLPFLTLFTMLNFAASGSAQDAGSAQDESAEQGVESIPVLVLDLESSGLPKDQVGVLNDILGQSVSRVPDTQVTTTADMRRMGGVEAQKELLGCEDQSSCLVDLADDFGARYVVFGSVAELGEVFVMQLTLFDSEKAEAVKRTRVQSQTLSTIGEQIDGAVDELFRAIGAMPSPLADESGLNPAWYLVGTGGAAAVTGIGGFIVGAIFANQNADHQQDAADQRELSSTTEDLAEKESALDIAKSAQVDAEAARANANIAYGAGGALTALGVIVIGAGVAWMFMGGESE